MGKLDDSSLPDFPTLAGAYDRPAGTDAEAMLVSIWADVERLFPDGGKAEIWRHTALEKLKAFDEQWRREHPEDSDGSDEGDHRAAAS